MADDTRRRDSTLREMSLNAESAINLLDMSMGEDVTLSESVLDISRDPDILVTCTRSIEANKATPAATDFLGDATPLQARTIHPSSSYIPLQLATSTHILAPNIKSSLQSAEGGEDVEDVARLLIATERIRAERDALYAQLEFLEAETNIERRALNDRLTSQTAKLESQRQRIAALQQGDTKGEGQASLVHTRLQYVRRLSRAITALGLVVQHCDHLDPTPAMMKELPSESDQEGDRLRRQIIYLESELKLLQENFQQVQQDYDGHLWTCASGTAFHESDPRIQELEARIARRTERIGILQHDIKRLECNLSLAEEQITELSIELEAATTDKQCLMEDCTTARQERYAARESIAALENQCDALRSENATRFAEIEFSNQEREAVATRINSLETRCGSLEASLKVKENEIDEISRAKDQQLIRALKRCDAAEATAASLKLSNDRLSSERTVHLEEIEAMKQELNSTKELLELTNTTQAETLEQIQLQECVAQSRINELGKQCQDLECSLNSRCAELEIVRQQCLDVKRQKQQVEGEWSALQVEFADQSNQLATMRTTLETYQSEMKSAHTIHHNTAATMIEQLLVGVARRRAIGRAFGCLDERTRMDKDSLLQKIEVCKESIDTLQRHCRVKDDGLKKQEVIMLSLSHELAAVRSDLRATTDAMESQDALLHRLRSDLQHQREQNDSQSNSQVLEMENQLRKSIDRATRLEEASDQDQRRINSLLQDHISMEAHIATQNELLTELEAAFRLTETKNNEAVLSSRERLNDLERQVRQLEETALTLRNDLVLAQSESADLQAISAVKDSLEEELADLKEEIRLKQESKAQELESLQGSVQVLEARSRDIEKERLAEKTSYMKDIASRQQELEALASQLEELRKQRDDALKFLQCQEEMLQECRTNMDDLRGHQNGLETQIQKKNTELERLLEQVKHTAVDLRKSRDEVNNLQTHVQQLRKDLSNVSQASNTAQLEFDLQASRFQQEIATLKRALAKYQQQPSLQEKVETLEARNEELEDMLQARCAEIEDNDDRFIEVLKEKKKLNAKVETLNRKLYKLQKQLTEASEAPVAPATPPAEPSPALQPYYMITDTIRLGSENASHPTPPQLPHIEKMKLDSTKENHQPAGPSGERSSSKPRPIMRMPELHASPPDAPMSRKRPAPDDFDPVLPSVAQPVVATSPARGLRKALNGIRSGFTPTRNSLSQSPLKKKSAPSLGISDITNSPRTRTVASTSNTAGRGRSWLGKIRSDSGSRPTSQSFNLPPFEPQTPFP